MRKIRFIALLLAMLPGMVTTAMAEGLLPDIPEAQGRFSEAQGCVEPTADMRKNHMETNRLCGVIIRGHTDRAFENQVEGVGRISRIRVPDVHPG